MVPSECLILFTRYPEPGTTKTRLIPHLGPQGAADLQRKMTEHALNQARPLMDSRGVCLEVRYDGGDEKRMKIWLGESLTFTEQGAGDIGRRMARAFQDAKGLGCTSVIIIGTDIPGITTSLLEHAFDNLRSNPLVLGPAKDGGYYLIGLPSRLLDQLAPVLFTRMPWGTSAVFKKTCLRLQHQKITYSLLANLADVDRPDDLPVWQRCRPK